MLAQGNKVVATARAPVKAEDLRALAEKHGDKLVLTALDTASPNSISSWADGLKGKIDHADVSTKLVTFHFAALTDTY